MSEPWTIVEILFAVFLAMILIPGLAFMAFGIWEEVQAGRKLKQGLIESRANMERIRREIGEEAFERLTRREPKPIETPQSKKMKRLQWGYHPAYKESFTRFTDEENQIERRLQTIANEYLPLFGGMPKVKAVIIDPNYSFADDYASSNWKRTLARGGSGFVYISYHYYKEADDFDLRHTMLHEMTHNWIQWNEIEMKDPHGKQFQEKLQEVLAQTI